jgi:hypothetical protein
MYSFQIETFGHDNKLRYWEIAGQYVPCIKAGEE